MNKIEAQHALVDGKKIGHDGWTIAWVQMIGRRIYSRNGAIMTSEGDLFCNKAAEDGYYIWKEQEENPEKKSRIVKHEVISTDQNLYANSISLDCWLGRTDFIGFEYDGENCTFTAPVMYSEQGGIKYHTKLENIDTGFATEIHPIKVWQRVKGKV